MVEAGHQGGLLAEIARQRNHLDIERVGRKIACDGKRIVAAAVIDIDDFAGEPEALPQGSRSELSPAASL
jgi:hypothetical protein